MKNKEILQLLITFIVLLMKGVYKIMEETKRLYRIPSEGMIGGVCAGLGEYLSADPTLIRLIFVILALAGMSGVLIYIIMWIVVPVKPKQVESESESIDSEQVS